MTDNPNPPRPISRLYSRYLTPQEKQALRLVPVAGVSSEINLLHLLTAHFLRFQQSAPPDLASQLQALRTFTLLCGQLAILVRSHDREHGPQSEMDEILQDALAGLPLYETDKKEKS
jgi:hypothetical protein